jgi:polyribonucleotide nucleotidyltransferase
VVNPIAKMLDRSDLHLMLAGTKEAVMMVEAGAKEISSADVLKCIAAGHEVIKELVAVQEQMVADVGVAKMEVVTKELPQDLIEACRFGP